MKGIKEEVYESLKNMQIDDYIKDLISDYLYYARYLNLIDNNISNVDLLTRFKSIIGRVEFFDEDHEINKKYGKKFKGVPIKFPDGDKLPTLYVRKSLGKKVELFFS